MDDDNTPKKEAKYSYKFLSTWFEKCPFLTLRNVSKPHTCCKMFRADLMPQNIFFFSQPNVGGYADIKYIPTSCLITSTHQYSITEIITWLCSLKNQLIIFWFTIITIYPPPPFIVPSLPFNSSPSPRP